MFAQCFFLAYHPPPQKLVVVVIVFSSIRPLLVVTLLASGATQTHAAEAYSAQTVTASEIPDAAELWQPQSSAADARGLEIFTEADRRLQGYGDLEVDLKMVLRTAKGRETERQLRIKQLEVADDGDRVLAVFDAPANIRGTALLSYGHIDVDDDQWLYLPAVKRAKKIASRDKTGSFVGSEFSFEDLAPLEVAKYRYQFIKGEACELSQCYIIDRFPVNSFSGYSKHRVWLDTEHLRILRIEFTDKRERLEKRLVLSDYQHYDQGYFRPGFMRMDNLLTGRSTDLHWLNYQFGNQLDADRDFSVNALRRAR